MARLPSARWLCAAAAALVASGSAAQVPSAAPDAAAPDTRSATTLPHAGGSPPARAPAASAGMKAYADPATGTLLDRPPPNAASKALPPEPHLHAFDRVWEETLPDGTGLVYFEGAMEMSVVATVDADGNVVQSCMPAAAGHRADPPPGPGAPAAEAAPHADGHAEPQP